MTQYRQPNYDVKLSMSHRDFYNISGSAFDVIVSFRNHHHRTTGMLIVSRGNDFCKSNPIATAWLWTANYKSAPVDTQLTIPLGNVCEPMVPEEVISVLGCHNGLTLKGVVTRNWNTDY